MRRQDQKKYQKCGYYLHLQLHGFQFGIEVRITIRKPRREAPYRVDAIVGPLLVSTTIDVY